MTGLGHTALAAAVAPRDVCFSRIIGLLSPFIVQRGSLRGQ
jgi:hypothetical protein